VLARIPRKVYQAERFPVNTLPQREGTVYELPGIVEYNEARGQDTGRQGNGSGDGLESVSYGVIVVGSYSEDHVISGIDTIRDAC